MDFQWNTDVQATHIGFDEVTRDDEVLEFFSYSDNEQEMFPFIREYMRKIKPKLPQILEDQEGRERFMLAGLFLSYVALNHLGENMTTETDKSDLISENNLHLQRLEAYKRLTGKSIESTAQYLRMIRLSIIKRIFLRQEDMLYNFVTHN
jgi:hypothetical protein